MIEVWAWLCFRNSLTSSLDWNYSHTIFFYTKFIWFSFPFSPFSPIIYYRPLNGIFRLYFFFFFPVFSMANNSIGVSFDNGIGSCNCLDAFSSFQFFFRRLLFSSRKKLKAKINDRVYVCVHSPITLFFLERIVVGWQCDFQ